MHPKIAHIRIFAIGVSQPPILRLLLPVHATSANESIHANICQLQCTPLSMPCWATHQLKPFLQTEGECSYSVGVASVFNPVVFQSKNESFPRTESNQMGFPKQKSQDQSSQACAACAHGHTWQ